MKKIVAAFGVLALSVAVSASAMAGGYGNDPDRADQPQAQVPNGDAGKPGGFGGGGFGTSDVGHTSPNGHTDPSGTNGNQASETGAAHSGNVDRGNAGGPGEGCDSECGGEGGGE